MEEKLPPYIPEEGYIKPGGHDICPYDGKYCFKKLRCMTGNPYGEGWITYCPRYPIE